MSVIKQDQAENAHSFDLDREAWVMLVGFPEDLKDSAGIAKAVSGFGILVHWHEPDNLARVVAKVYLNDDAKIPDSVKVNAGLPQKGRSWTVPCFIYSEEEAAEPVPLAINPPAGFEIAAHLSKEVLEGIGQGILQIQPTAVSAALLNSDDLGE